LSNITVPSQAIGTCIPPPDVSSSLFFQNFVGLVTKSNITFQESISGVIGLSFPRLSRITNTISTGESEHTHSANDISTRASILAIPFFASLAQQGLLSYPLFGLSLTRGNNGTLTLGAIDSSVVHDLNNITWSEVSEFSPFGTERNSSGYLQWALPLLNITVNGTGITPRPTYANQTQNTSIALLDV
jgi:hypothetical protein